MRCGNTPPAFPLSESFLTAVQQLIPIHVSYIQSKLNFSRRYQTRLFSVRLLPESWYFKMLKQLAWMRATEAPEETSSVLLSASLSVCYEKPWSFAWSRAVSSWVWKPSSFSFIALPGNSISAAIKRKGRKCWCGSGAVESGRGYIRDSEMCSNRRPHYA